ncbi:MAG: carbohydrate-binding protein, partial [Butyrivibrio sp.]|nr:carbohydrate-binding protein [Butyrivibrio sp.]
MEGVFTEEDGNTTVVSLVQGNYFLVKDVNFSQGLSEIAVTIKADAPGVIVIKKGGVDGETIGNIKFSNTDGEYKEFTGKIQSFTGTTELAFVEAAGSCSIDKWSALPDSEPAEPEDPDQPNQPDEPDQPENPDQPEQPEQPDQPEEPVSEAVNPYEKVEAETATMLTDSRVTPNKKAVSFSDGGYIVAESVDFSKGLSGFKVYAQASQPKVKLNIYIDGAKSPITQVAIGTDMTKETYVKVSSNLTGKHEVYFEAKGGALTFDAWQALEAQGTDEPEQPDNPEQPVGDKVNPYETVEAEASAELNSAMVTPNKQAVSISKGGYAVAKNVNFSKGVASFVVKAGASG